MSLLFIRKGQRTVHPISITSQVCKVMESIVRDHVTQHIKKFNLIRDTQHGFVKNKSCLTNLLKFFDTVGKYVDRGKPVDVLFLDFQKAFDKVPHQRLLLKIKAHGIDGKICKWIGNWLSDREQRVVINGSISDWVPVLSGVPQDSVLGSILFVLYRVVQKK